MNSSPRALRACDDLRRVVEHGGVDQMRRRQVELVEQFQAAPHADPVAVVAPGKGARIGRRVGDGEQVALTCAESEMLDVQPEIDREPLAARPGIILALGDRRIGVAVVVRQAMVCGSSVVGSGEVGIHGAESGDGLGVEGALLGPGLSDGPPLVVEVAVGVACRAPAWR